VFHLRYELDFCILFRRNSVFNCRVEAGSNTSTVALRVVGGDEKGTQCLGLQPGHPVPGGYKYGDLALQVGGVSKQRQQNEVMNPGTRT
jgi:hypothetical protein